MSGPLRWSYDKATDQHKGTCAEIQLLHCLQQDDALFSAGHFKAAKFKAQSYGGMEKEKLSQRKMNILVPKWISQVCHSVHV